MTDRGRTLEAIVAAIDEIALIVIVTLVIVGVLYDRGYMTLADAAIISVFLLAVSGFIAYKVVESQKEAVKTGLEAMVGRSGYASDSMKPGEEGFVVIEGEYWRAVNVSNRSISKDEKIRVVRVRGLLLEVAPYDEEQRVRV